MGARFRAAKLTEDVCFQCATLHPIQAGSKTRSLYIRAAYETNLLAAFVENVRVGAVMMEAARDEWVTSKLFFMSNVIF